MSGLTLLLLLVALVVGVRLYWALGTRNKNYEEQQRAYRGLHERMRGAGSAKAVAKPAVPPRQPAAKAAAASDFAAAARAIQAHEPDFTLQKFVTQAEKAYRLIVRLYAAGDAAKLRPLLTPAVYKDFRAGIAARRQAGQRLATEILSLGAPRVRAMKVKSGRGGRARITLAFDCDLISALYGPKDELLEGDANQAMELRDIWCFERILGASSPNWRLAETETQPRRA